MIERCETRKEQVRADVWALMIRTAKVWASETNLMDYKV